MKNTNTNKTKFLITIAGPTAVGKTDTVLKVAKKYNSDIFSCDSRQIYKELSIGTAKPSSAELSSVKHHFIDHVSITEPYNAGKYEREFLDTSTQYFQQNDIGILTGGTGMYIRAALEGMDHFPEVSSDIRGKYSKMLETEGIESLQVLIRKKDPEYAESMDISNPRRLTRALEVIEVEGKPYSYYLSKKAERQLPFTPIKVCLVRDREELYARINMRVDQMMEDGLLQEVESLVHQKELKALETVGYSELFQFLNNEISLDKAVELIKRNSRRYAKRQMTWFRNQGEWKMVPADDTDQLYSYIDSQLLNLTENQ